MLTPVEGEYLPFPTCQIVARLRSGDSSPRSKVSPRPKPSKTSERRRSMRPRSPSKSKSKSKRPGSASKKIRPRSAANTGEIMSKPTFIPMDACSSILGRFEDVTSARIVEPRDPRAGGSVVIKITFSVNTSLHYGDWLVAKIEGFTALVSRPYLSAQSSLRPDAALVSRPYLSAQSSLRPDDTSAMFVKLDIRSMTPGGFAKSILWDEANQQVSVSLTMCVCACVCARESVSKCVRE